MTSPLDFLTRCDPVSSLFHLFGALLAAVATVPLLRRSPASSGHRPYLWTFAASAIFLLSASGLYHLLPRGSAARALFQRIDHAAIFALIAGTFTAGHGLFFSGMWRRGMIAAFWTLGACGAVSKIMLFNYISNTVGLSLYLAMGWLGLPTMFKLLHLGQVRPALHLTCGGIVYTLGAVCDHCAPSSLSVMPGVFGAHELFHLTVLGGLFTHWRLFAQTALTASVRKVS